MSSKIYYVRFIKSEENNELMKNEEEEGEKR